MERLTLIFCAAFFACTAGQDGPIVDTTHGPVQGVNVNMASGDVIQSWMAIPFGQPPVGMLRFERPQPPEPWTEVRNASSLGYSCMQPSYYGSILWDMYVNSENCLHLNVYSKQRAETVLQPVMVWIHGGGFQYGTNFEYPGYFLAEKDVVFVALNYRLGMLGWAYTGDGVLNGNQGLWDNILALEWIRDNIAGFGGDPNRVIVFGQSSGGSSTGALQHAPQAEGLFHGAILQSGAGIAPWSVMLEKFGAEDYMYQMAVKFGCDNSSMQAIVDCMRVQDAQDIADLDSVDCPTGSTACQGFQPVVDGELIPDVPILMRERGEYHKMPEMLGLTEEDGFGWGPVWVWAGLTREQIEDWWNRLASWCAVLWPDPTAKEDVIQATNWFYADWPYLNDTDRNRGMMGYFLTDYWYGASADYQAKTTSVEGLPAYFYVYKYMLENSDPNDWNGTPHSAEIAPLFGYPLLLDNEEALAHSQFPAAALAAYRFTQRDKDYSDFLCTLWTNFAKHWDPTPEPVGPPGGSQIDWNGYEVGNLSYAYLDVDPYTALDYRQREYAYHNRYLNYIIYGKEFYLEEYEKRN